MDRRTITSLVDAIESELGPGAEPARVEGLATAVLSGLSARAATPIADGRVDPVGMSVHVRVDDCTGRLLQSVKAHCYDRIRRLTNAVVSGAHSFFSQEGVHRPAPSLCVHGLTPLLSRFSDSERVELARTVEQAGMDAGFEYIDLAILAAGRNDSAAVLLSSVSELVNAGTKTRISIEVGSSAVGIRARELLAAAQILCDPARIKDSFPRITLVANEQDPFTPFVHGGGAVRLDLHASVWPELIRNDSALTPDSCYGDRGELLADAGLDTWRRLRGMLDRLVASLQATGMDIGPGRTCISVDAPGEGPLPAAIWCGLPADTVSESAAGRSAAMLLAGSIHGRLGSSTDTAVCADGLPLTYSIRNVIAVEAGTPQAELAGRLVDLFADAVRDGRSRWLHVATVQKAAERGGVQLGGVPGVVPVASGVPGWTEEHFERGGALIPPHSNGF